MSTAMTIKGQITIPKRVREAAGIHPGDRVEVEIGVGGSVTVRKAATAPSVRALAAARVRIDAAIGQAREARSADGLTTDAVMRLLRAES